MAEESRLTRKDYEEIQTDLESKTKYRPKIGIICGSGLGGLADRLTDAETFPYEKIPKFPVSTVPGHAGQLVFGLLGGKEVVCMKGRFHFYEGYPAWKLTIPIRVMHLMGVKTVIVTSAAGGVNQQYNVGDFMVIKDHINMVGLGGNHPLVGPNDDSFGERFVPMSKVYDKGLRELVKGTAKELKLDELIREGVYCMVSGPTYETPAEVRYLEKIGVDAVGMSTCPEVTVARHCGMRVFGMSLITNKCVSVYDTDEGPSHQEVLRIGAEAATKMEKLIETCVGKMDEPST
ncbi:purine nucleoside phosphorylase-like [Ptychodera flava]|uniref:purine nucleoside phosphorylase-like n=1 Tax=Ptychodera flava TaxID=63121 RepID=UPI00396A8A55